MSDCGRCTFPMTEVKNVFTCTHCKMVIDLNKNTCQFQAGPYTVILLDSLMESNQLVTKTIISKGLKQLQLDQELSHKIEQEELDSIWKRLKG